VATCAALLVLWACAPATPTGGAPSNQAPASAPAAGQPAAPAQPTMQKITFVTDFGFLGRHSMFYTTLEKGFWKDAGFDVSIVRGGGSLDSLKQVAAGKADFGYADTGALIVARATEDIPVKELAIIYQRAPQGIYCLEESGIRTPKDLEGKVLSDSAASSLPKLFPAYARLAGIDNSKVTWKYADSATLPALLNTKQVDCVAQFVVGEPLLEAALGGKKMVRFLFADAGMDMYANGIIAASDTIRKDPEMVRRFVAATLKGIQYAFDHPEEAGQIMNRAHPEMAADVAAGETRLVREVAVTDDTRRLGLGAIDAARMEKTRDLLSEALELPQRSPIEELYAPGFTPPAS
jgi:NitT/TauT family transport system substrate-binding protein